jgi:DNA-binding NarL/FixJ family response regulator
MRERNGDGPIKVLLADNHTMFREGLARMLASHGDMEVIGEITNDERVVELSREARPDVVIMEVQMPFERARENLRRLRELSPPPKVVIVTMFEDPGYMRELTSLGASAYLVKSASVDHLLGAICAVVFGPKGENVVVGTPRAMLEEAKRGSEGILSARELEILQLVSRGMSNRQVASTLDIEEATVKRHLANTYLKMGVSSRGEATRKALYEEWITIGDITQDKEEG